MSNYQQLLSILPTLTHTQLEQVKAKVEFLLQTTSGTTTRASESWLLSGISEVLKARGVNSYLPTDARVLRQVHELEKTLEERIGRTMTTAEKLLLGRLAAGALADFISNYAVVSRQMMLRSLAKTPEAIEASFPGYMGSGVLGVLVSRRLEAGL